MSAPDTAVPEATVIPIPTLTPRISSHSPNPLAPALLTLAQRSEPNLVAGRGTLVAFTLDIVNRGLGATTKAVVTMPIDPAEVAVVDVQLSRPDAWVSMLLHDRIELSVDKPLAPGERVAVTVRLRVLPRVVLGAILGESLTVRWSDDAGGGARRGNIAPLVAGATNESAPVYPLHGETAAGTSQTFRARIFAPDEPVSLWWATPTGANIAKGELWAGVDGTITTTVNTAGLAPGAYTVVAYGQWTAFTAVGSFVVR